MTNFAASIRKRTSPITFIACILLIAPVTVLSQERRQGREFPNRPSVVTFETVRLPGTDSTKADIDVLYRIPRSFFIFVRSRGQVDSMNNFIARGQLQVELNDEQDVSVARNIRPIELNRVSLPQGEEQQGDIEGAISFSLVPGKYKIIFEVDDLESGRLFLDKDHIVQAQSFAATSLEISPLFFARVDSTPDRGVQYFPFNHGTDVLFGAARGGTLCQLHVPDADTGMKLNWKLHGEEENRSEQIIDLTGTTFDLVEGRLNLASKEGTVRYSTGHADRSVKTFFVPLPFEILEPGHYKLEITLTSGKDQAKQEISFRVVWPNRPMSLTDWDIATDALRYIAKPEEMDKILASSETGLKEFRAFWRAKDPDTTTAYNELMVEYYRRVDESIRQYSTVKEQDGYKTDRGRIYILNGPPTHVERSVLPGQPTREIWTYDNLRKQFVFTEKNKSGNYILTQSANF